MKVLGTLRALDETRGAVRIEETYDTDIDDLWEACTQPARLARWIADVSGDLRLDGEFAAAFTSGWEGRARVDACESPRHLLVTTWESDPEQSNVIEVTLEADGDRTTLVIEERGVPLAQAAAYGAGWQIHAEDLAAHVAEGERCDMKTRWSELIPHYQGLAVQ